ncbi:hypothetical protein [Hymenobacter crusticola]|uniref:Uncharacterized protein n=1 Tax=Hymenobacter crusticola TaxID=1770526 RepID=A0A243W829_9BACT|nr:hypothetical protein [Hymenobacter crusticola]OUJ71227.1 hypothetical protein BXP70_22365 [Hymenobacter crusticola]
MPTPPDTPRLPDLSAIRGEKRPARKTNLATAEQDWFEQDKRKGAHRRDQRAKNVIHYTVLSLVVVAGICLAVGIVIRVCHLILPADQLWLTKEQTDFIDHLAQLAGSGVLGGLLTKYLSRNIEA